MNESSNRFLDEMAEDFFAECDELLSVIKRDLLKIEDLGNEPVPSALTEELVRSCHTLKGLTGMVGAENTMKLIHSIETFLKKVQKKENSFTHNAIDILFRSVSIIENQIESLRKREDLPDVSEVIQEVDKLVLIGNESKTEEETTGSDINSKEKPEGERLWRFSFTPSRELYKDGVNINDIRNRMNRLGKVLSSVPEIDDKGSVSFHFIVATAEQESAFGELRSAGVSFEEVTSVSGSDPGLPVDYGTEVQDRLTDIYPKNVVRVDLTRLDNIMKSVGDLVISRSRLNDHLQKNGSNGEHESLLEINTKMEKQIRDLREGIMRLRMVKTEEAFERMKFVVRDLIKKSDKSIKLEIEGEDTQVDKFVMERIFDPLMHLVRNGVSHGIEPPDERIAAGKSRTGTLVLRSYASGNVVIFEVGDDGYGIDRKAIGVVAERMNLIKPGRELSDQELLDVICTAGFTTREQSDIVSGRGVGMDIVRRSVNELGGTMELHTTLGSGTRFMIHLPLTLSIVDALIVSSGNRTFAIPVPSVEEVTSLDQSEIMRFGNNELISFRDFALPVLRLNEFFNLQGERSIPNHLLIVGQENGRVGISVDRITGQREIVVRSLTDPLVKVEGISGVTDLGEGKIVLILDASALVRSAGRQNKEHLTVR